MNIIVMILQRKIVKDKIIIPIFYINAQLICYFISEIYYKYGQELIVDNIDNVKIHANDNVT